MPKKSEKVTQRGGKGGSGKDEKPPRKLMLKQTPRPSGNLQGISIRMPLGYLHILTVEADRAGLKRSAFLTQLLRRKRNEILVERAPDGPVYEFTDDELRETKMWVWYVTPEVYKIVDADRLQMGVGTFVAWVTQMLNHWIGKPGGLRS